MRYGVISLVVGLALSGAAISFFPEPASAETITRCYHAKPPVMRDQSWNTGTHGPGRDSYYSHSGYRIGCRTGSRGAVLNWASLCAQYYSRFYKNSPYPSGGCPFR